MEIMFTEIAKERIAEKTADKQGYLKLKYDTEGCGCVVNGVPTLWFVHSLEEEDIEIHTNSMSIYIEKSKMIFFDDEMKIDFKPQFNCFQLKSPNQILNPRMSFFDQTKKSS